MSLCCIAGSSHEQDHKLSEPGQLKMYSDWDTGWKIWLRHRCKNNKINLFSKTSRHFTNSTCLLFDRTAALFSGQSGRRVRLTIQIHLVTSSGMKLHLHSLACLLGVYRNKLTLLQTINNINTYLRFSLYCNQTFAEERYLDNKSYYFVSTPFQDSVPLPIDAVGCLVAHLVEHCARRRKVAGSIPTDPSVREV